MWEKNHMLLQSLYSFNIRKTCSQYSTGTDSYQYTSTHLQKAITFSHSPASTGRELEPPQLLYQPLCLLVCRCKPTEGSNLCSFSSCYQKGAPTPWLLYLPICLPICRLRPTRAGTMFHKFLDQILLVHNNTISRSCFIQFSYRTYHQH